MTIIDTTFESGTTETLVLDENVGNHVAVEFTPGSDADIARLDIPAMADSGEADLRVEFEATCTPPDPFYARWINHLGGHEFQMFDQRKELASEASGFVDFHPWQGFDNSANRTREIIDITDPKRTAVVGLEQLDRGEFDRLAALIFSPSIEVWNPSLQRWEGVTLDKNTSIVWDTDHSRGSVELTFQLLTPKLQF